MLNRAPIFINAFSRGGSNILWNIFLTHPDVCSPILETLDIFRIGRYGRWSGYQSAWHTRQLRFFDQRKLAKRKPISERAQVYIDQVLYAWKLKTFTDSEMSYKYEDEPYTLDEIKEARLVAKNNNGLVFLSDVFFDMYPDATFVALVRNPLALYESYKRRHFVQSPDEFIEFYVRIAERMLVDADCYKRYHIIRFEDILGDLEATVARLYEWAGLDPDQIGKIRFKAKKHFRANGVRKNEYAIGQHHWFTFEEANAFLESGVNKYQIERLDSAEKRTVFDRVQVYIERFDYVGEIAACD